MKGDQQVLVFLNNALKGELTAINQYFLHYKMLQNWGISKLAKHEYDESIDEMKHADRLADRILFLGGLPNFQDLDKLLIGENVEEIIACDMKLEYAGIANYRAGIAHCDTVQDYVTRDLFVEILKEEEGHVDFLETQQELIGRIGVQNYIQLNSTPVTDQKH